jgi:hypothetical protein
MTKLDNNNTELQNILAIINNLPNGGEGGSLPKGWATGQFIPTNETMLGDFYIEHGLGAIPNMVVIFRENPMLLGRAIRSVFRVNASSTTVEETGEVYPMYSSGAVYYDAQDISEVFETVDVGEYNDSPTSFCVPQGIDALMYLPGFSYKWIAIKLED